MDTNEEKKSVVSNNTKNEYLDEKSGSEDVKPKFLPTLSLDFLYLSLILKPPLGVINNVKEAWNKYVDNKSGKPHPNSRSALYWDNSSEGYSLVKFAPHVDELSFHIDGGKEKNKKALKILLAFLAIGGIAIAALLGALLLVVVIFLLICCLIFSLSQIFKLSALLFDSKAKISFYAVVKATLFVYCITKFTGILCSQINWLLTYNTLKVVSHSIVGMQPMLVGVLAFTLAVIVSSAIIYGLEKIFEKKLLREKSRNNQAVENTPTDNNDNNTNDTNIRSSSKCFDKIMDVFYFEEDQSLIDALSGCKNSLPLKYIKLIFLIAFPVCFGKLLYHKMIWLIAKFSMTSFGKLSFIHWLTPMPIVLTLFSMILVLFIFNITLNKLYTLSLNKIPENEKQLISIFDYPDEFFLENSSTNVERLPLIESTINPARVHLQASLPIQLKNQENDEEEKTNVEVSCKIQ